MKEKNEVLERQHEDGNLLIDVLKGAVAVMETAKVALTDCQPEKLVESLECIGKFLEQVDQSGLAESMILKIQRPLSTNVEGPEEFLIYNEDKSLLDQVVLEDPALVGLFGEDLKMYVNSRLWSDGTLQIIDRIEDQDW